MKYMLKKTRVDPKQTALLIADQNSNKEDMEKIIALAFEGIGLPSVFSIKKSILSLFANGKTSGIVLETGANITQVAPVSEGYVLHKSLLTQSVGGDTISENIVKYIEDSQQKELLPRFMFKYNTDTFGNVTIKQRPLEVSAVSASVLEFHKLRVAQDIKELYCRLLNTNDDINTEHAMYELPDGTTMNFGQTRYAFPEIFFNDTQVGAVD
jgi:actin-related protein